MDGRPAKLRDLEPDPHKTKKELMLKEVANIPTPSEHERKFLLEVLGEAFEHVVVSMGIRVFPSSLLDFVLRVGLVLSPSSTGGHQIWRVRPDLALITPEIGESFAARDAGSLNIGGCTAEASRAGP